MAGDKDSRDWEGYITGAGKSRSGIHRRDMFRNATAVGVSASLSGAARSQTLSPGAEGPALPSHEKLQELTQRMVCFGQRYVGTAAHRDYVDFLAREFESLGLTVKRDRQDFENWDATSWSLSIGSGPTEQQLPVAAYYTYSGETPASGVEGELVWLDGADPNGKDLTGKIVAFHRKIEPNVLGQILGLVGSDKPNSTPLVQDAVIRSIRPSRKDVSMDRNNFVLHLISEPTITALKAAGALGAIIVEDEVPSLSLDGTYAPFHLPYQNIPALFVNAASGRTLEAHRWPRTVDFAGNAFGNPYGTPLGRNSRE